MTNILITGGTGLIGTALTKLFLQQNHVVTILSRNPVRSHKPFAKITNSSANLQFRKWDPLNRRIDEAVIRDADYIINLSGANLADKRWTSKVKKEIVESRVSSGETIVKALSEIPNRVKAVVQASAIGWYGPDQEIPNATPFAETDPAAQDFLGSTCSIWESSIRPVESLNKRLVILRTSVVLSNDGGALPKFKKPLYFGLATILGNGRQVISWIHITDLCNLYLKAIEDEQMKGVYNATAPHPVTNRSFVLTLARHVRGKFFIPVYIPAFVLKIVLGELSVEPLKSATVSSQKIESKGFNFQFPWIENAFADLTKRK